MSLSIGNYGQNSLSGAVLNYLMDNRLPIQESLKEIHFVVEIKNISFKSTEQTEEAKHKDKTNQLLKDMAQGVRCHNLSVEVYLPKE